MHTSFTITKRDGTKLRVLLDQEDAELREMSWHMAGGKGPVGKYVATRDPTGRTVYIHQMVASRAELLPLQKDTGQRGAWKVSIDHINGNKLDNRRSNLRVSSRQQQMLNPNDRLRRNNTSGVRGVSYYPSRAHNKPWMAYVQHDYKSKNLGWYATKEEAVAARKEWDRTH